MTRHWSTSPALRCAVLAALLGVLAGSGRAQVGGEPAAPADHRGGRRSADSAEAAAAKVGALSYHALLIGIEGYTHESWKPLRSPRADVDALAAVLGTHYGFATADIKKLPEQQATRTGILKAIHDYSFLDEDDCLLVYYAGHGHLDQASNEVYWVPVDGQGADAPFTLVSWPEVKREILKLAARHVLVIADSCFAGGMTRSGSSLTRSLELAMQKPSRRVIAAGGFEYVADGNGRSPFSRALVELLAQNRAPYYRALGELYRPLADTVTNTTSQVPCYGPILKPGETTVGFGDFVFRRQNADGGGGGPGGAAPAGAGEVGGTRGVRDASVPDEWPILYPMPAFVKPQQNPDGTWHYTLGDDPSPMVLVGAGRFRPGGGDFTEIKTPFLIDLHEVTVARFRPFLAKNREHAGRLGRWDPSDPDRRPITEIDLETARAFARWAQKELPTSLQWEYAALRDSGFRYPWGERFEDGGVDRVQSFPLVGECPGDLSPWRVAGMSSCVQEWCLIEAAPRDSPKEGVVRGGSNYVTNPIVNSLKQPATVHRVVAAGRRAPDLGFRCVWELRR